jgi:hypothetical protein
MTPLLFGLFLSATLSLTSLLVVLFRVSPLLSPTQALPAFFVSLFLSIASVATLAFFGIWKALPVHAWDSGKILSISIRQGIFLGTATVLMLLLHLLGLFTWWIVIALYSVFLIIEIALHS